MIPKLDFLFATVYYKLHNNRSTQRQELSRAVKRGNGKRSGVGTDMTYLLSAILHVLKQRLKGMAEVGDKVGGEALVYARLPLQHRYDSLPALTQCPNERE